MDYKFKLGDRVRFKEEYEGQKIGSTGEVISYEKGITGPTAKYHGEHALYHVRLDSGITKAVFERRIELAFNATHTHSLTAGDSVLDKVARVSKLFGHRRPLGPVMLQLSEELGELSTEVAIVQGTKNREPSADGVVGEAVDVAIVALDVALLESGGDIELIKATFEKKLAKWESYK